MSFTCFTDTNVGQTTDATKVEEIHNCHGQHYWKASCKIETLFGQPVEGCEVFGIGKTKELALERLKKELKEFNDSLWY